MKKQKIISNSNINLIQEWIDHFGITQGILAQKTGKNPSTISLWLGEKSKPFNSSLQLVAKSLGLSFEEFMAGPEEYKRKKQQTQNQALVVPGDLAERAHELSKKYGIGEDVLLRTALTAFFEMPPWIQATIMDAVRSHFGNSALRDPLTDDTNSDQ